jgi:hypothetical protein
VGRIDLYHHQYGFDDDRRGSVAADGEQWFCIFMDCSLNRIKR